MATTFKKKKESSLPAAVKYALTLVIVAGIGYGGYVAQQSNDRATAQLRASCSSAGGGGGLTSFGTCR